MSETGQSKYVNLDQLTQNAVSDQDLHYLSLL